MAWPPTTHQDAADEITSLRDGKGWASTLGGRQRVGEVMKPASLLWIVGRWYNAQMIASGTTNAPTASELRVASLYVPTPRAIDRIGCSVSTAGTGGHVARLGIYNSDPATGLPTTVLIDAGTVAVDTTGIKEIAVAATLHGLHWLGLTAQSGTFLAVGSANFPFPAGGTNPTTLPSFGVTYPTVDPTLALPDRTGVAPTYTGTATPTVGVRAA